MAQGMREGLGRLIRLAGVKRSIGQLLGQLGT